MIVYTYVSIKCIMEYDESYKDQTSAEIKDFRGQILEEVILSPISVVTFCLIGLYALVNIAQWQGMHAKPKGLGLVPTTIGNV